MTLNESAERLLKHNDFPFLEITEVKNSLQFFRKDDRECAALMNLLLRCFGKFEGKLSYDTRFLEALNMCVDESLKNSVKEWVSFCNDLRAETLLWLSASELDEDELALSNFIVWDSVEGNIVDEHDVELSEDRYLKVSDISEYLIEITNRSSIEWRMKVAKIFGFKVDEFQRDLIRADAEFTKVSEGCTENRFKLGRGTEPSRFWWLDRCPIKSIIR